MDPIAEIKEKLSIIDIISPYVNLRKRGSNWFGLCPFHNEKSASFSVNEDRGFYHCFGCSESGDIFNFVQKIEHTDFRGSLEILAKQANVDISSNSNFDQQYNNTKNKLIEINEFTKKFYSWILQKHQSGTRGREYIKKRNIYNSSVEVFGLGYAPIGYDNLYSKLKSRGYSDEDILESGVCIQRERDRTIIDKFRGRLMFPIENISGQTIAFSGRHIPTPTPDPKFTPPKYLNTGDTSIFNKGKVLYGFNQAKEEVIKKGFIIISEGQINIVSSHQVDHKNIVASMGTALTTDQLRLISRYTKNIYFCFDKDTAGYNAGLRGIKMALSMDFSIRIITLKEGSDPDEEIQKGHHLWAGDIDAAQEAFDFLIQESKKIYKSIEDKTKVLEKFVEIYEACSNPITKDVLVQKLSNEFTLPYETLIEYFSQKMTSLRTIKESIPSTNPAIYSNDMEEYTLALICQNYDELKPYVEEKFTKLFTRYETLYTQIVHTELNTLLNNKETSNQIGQLIAKDLPHHETVITAYKECIRSLQKSYIKYKIKALKEELSFADEDKQEQILTEIDKLIKTLETDNFS